MLARLKLYSRRKRGRIYCPLLWEGRMRTRDGLRSGSVKGTCARI